MMKILARVFLTTALAAIVSGVAIAQGAAAPPSKVYVIKATVAAEHVNVWTRAVQKVVEAHTQHEAGNVWAAYQMLTGGPDAEFVFMFPFNEFAELDGWKSNRRILVESLGANVGKQVAGILDLELRSVDRVITYVAELSHPRSPLRTTAPAFFWEYNTRVAKGKMTEYAALMRRAVRAHEQSEHGLDWLAYGNAVGGDREQVVYLVPFDRFADLDEWPVPGAVLGEVFGAREAARVGEALAEITETTHRIWRLRPALSRLPQQAR